MTSLDARKLPRPSPRLVVIGGSAGSLDVLKNAIEDLPADYPLAVAVVVHITAHLKTDLSMIFGSLAKMIRKEAQDKEAMCPGKVYVAPPGYHLLIENDETLSLSVDPPVNFARPAIDVLFESAAEALGPAVIGVLLSGASADGAKGLRSIAQAGGRAVVQDPKTAAFAVMPLAGLAAVADAEALGPKEIAALLWSYRSESDKR